MEPFIGEIRIFGCNFAPRGWAFCQGQLLPIAQNSALFSLLGTTYGGDGRVTFALPDLSSRAAMHPGSGPGLTPRRLGEITGTETVTVTEAQLPSHNHIISGAQMAASAAAPDPKKMLAMDRANSGDNIFYLADNATVNTTMSPAALSPTGGSQPHENRQPLLGMNYCIALIGLYPSRG